MFDVLTDPLGYGVQLMLMNVISSQRAGNVVGYQEG